MNPSVLNGILNKYDFSIGLGEDFSSWEWYDRNAEEHGGGFSSAMAAYQDARARIEEDIPHFDEPANDGFFIDSTGNIRNTYDPEPGTSVETHCTPEGKEVLWILDKDANVIRITPFHSTIEGVTEELLELFGHTSGATKKDRPSV